jgi:hypothetical protein
VSFDERLKSARRILEGVRGSLPLMWSRACEDWLGVREPGRTPWRVGSTIPRNIYDACERWKRRAEEFNQIAHGALASTERWQALAMTWKGTAETAMDTAKDWREVAELMRKKVDGP